VKVINPGQVPMPPFDPTYVYPPETEKARAFLTNLPAPSRRPAAHDVCSYCNGKVRQVKVTTHVPGTTPVMLLEPHMCRQPVR